MIFLFHESCPFLQSFYHEKNQAFEMKLFDWLKFHVKLLFEIGFLVGKQSGWNTPVMNLFKLFIANFLTPQK